MSSKKFVLLSAARSGTSMVMGALRKHPQFIIHGEIFHPRIEWHIRAEFLACNDIQKRETDPVEFTKDILSQNFGKDVVGFKIWYSQSVEACEYVMSDPDIIKIILERQNKLAHFSSGLLAQKTQVWNMKGKLKPSDKIPENTVSFKESHFLNFVKNNQDLFEIYGQKSVGPVLHLNYCQAARLEFDEIFSTLGVKNLQLAPPTNKLYSDNILNRFNPEDHEQIRATLQRINKLHWLEEAI